MSGLTSTLRDATQNMSSLERRLAGSDMCQRAVLFSGLNRYWKCLENCQASKLAKVADVPRHTRLGFREST